MALWIPIIAGLVVGIVLFFVLPFLEKPRQKVLGLLGLNPKREEPRTTMVTPNFIGPSPSDITQAICNVPLLQQDDAAKHYVGIRVEWTGELSGISRTGAGMVRLNVINWRQDDWNSFSFEVNSADYPGIGLLKDGARIRVTGYIKMANSFHIELRDAILLLYENKQPE